MRLSIQDVATRQVESAVWMYAYNYDEVAVHVVAASAFELTTKRLNLGDQKKIVESPIRPEKLKQFYRILNKPYNFFKHGEHDRKKLDYIDYEPASVEFLLLNACQANIAGPEKYRLNCANMFIKYFSLKYPDLLREGYREKIMSELKKRGISHQEAASRATLKSWLDLIENPLLAKNRKNKLQRAGGGG